MFLLTLFALTSIVNATFMCGEPPHCTCYENLPWIVCDKNLAKLDMEMRLKTTTVFLMHLKYFPKELLDRSQWPQLKTVDITRSSITCDSDLKTSHLRILGCTHISTSTHIQTARPTTLKTMTSPGSKFTWKTHLPPHGDVESSTIRTSSISTPTTHRSTAATFQETSTVPTSTTVTSQETVQPVVTDFRGGDDLQTTEHANIHPDPADFQDFHIIPLHVQGYVTIGLLVLCILMVICTIALAWCMCKALPQPCRCNFLKKMHPRRHP